MKVKGVKAEDPLGISALKEKESPVIWKQRNRSRKAGRRAKKSGPGSRISKRIQDVFPIPA